MQKERKKQLVSVIVLTYNHENFIENALMGIITQKCNFDLELIIANDSSKDQTDFIIKKILQKYSYLFIRIKYIRKERNIGLAAMIKESLRACKGEYIAICEGDDYWIDAYKLNKQIKFLNSNLQYNICGSRVRIKRLNGKEQESKKKIGEINFLNVLYENPFSTCSVVIRKPLKLEHLFFKNFDDFYVKDWPLWASLLMYGKGYNFDEVTAVYNEHQGGIFTGKALNEKLNFFLKDRILMIANFPQKKIIIKLYGLKILSLYLKNSVFKKQYKLSIKNNLKLIYYFLNA